MHYLLGYPRTYIHNNKPGLPTLGRLKARNKDYGKDNARPPHNAQPVQQRTLC